MKKLLIILLAVFIIIQFFPIDKSNPPVDPQMDFVTIKKTPDHLAKVIKSSCYDCHSNETVYPWYANISPASWLLKNHIDDGRKKLNFSTFATYDTKRQLHKLEESIEMIKTDEMPLESYVLGHPEAKLSAEQKQLLIDYFKKTQEDIKFNNPEL